ncbi:hypothetical protein T484DRAFT_1931985 [Baffinella frigidus]|nr:hypothetical protein T484DRAFT_1931985 [Cryptophyta sp. CCMP2293]|mmetsp:Transcript_37696/g.89192  ORF Transcript_37696/g.89192 Transcript_37696/m.89192 type:complete len:229 (+) Transcript_37696:41-727(+)
MHATHHSSQYLHAPTFPPYTPDTHRTPRIFPLVDFELSLSCARARTVLGLRVQEVEHPLNRVVALRRRIVEEVERERRLERRIARGGGVSAPELYGSRRIGRDVAAVSDHGVGAGEVRGEVRVVGRASLGREGGAIANGGARTGGSLAGEDAAGLVAEAGDERHEGRLQDGCLSLLARSLCVTRRRATRMQARSAERSEGGGEAVGHCAGADGRLRSVGRSIRGGALL